MTPALSIPATPEDLTVEWLDAVLRGGGHTGDARVVGFNSSPLGEGVGFVGLLRRIHLQYDRVAPGAPATIVGKFPSPNEASRQIAILFGLYQREVLFYSQLQPDVCLPSPKCYFAGMDDESAKYLVLLEDLTNGEFGDQVKGCTVEQIARVLRELGAFHGQWWEQPKLDELTYLPDYIDLVGGSIAQAYDPCWALFTERFGDRLSPEALEKGATLGPKLIAMLDGFRDRPQTLCHSDFRVDNIFFPAGDDGRPVVVVDWQAPLRSWAAAYDAIYVITGGLPIEERRKHEDELLRVYHTALVGAGVKDYSFEQLVADARIAMLGFFAIIGVIAAGSLDMVNERAVELFDAMLDRLMTAMEDHRIFDLLPEGAAAG